MTVLGSRLCALVAIGAMFVAGTALAGSSTNKGATPNGKPFVEIAGSIVEVEGEISSIQDQIDALVGRVDTIEGLQAALLTAVSNLEAENVTLQAQIDANASDVDSLEAQIVLLNGEILDLQDQIDANGDADGALQAEVDDLEGQVTTLALAIDTLEGDLQASIDNNTDLIDNMQTQIDTLAVELAEKQNRVNGLCADGSAIQEILADGSVICEAASGGGAGTLNTYVSSYVSNGNGWRSASASCPSGYRVTGGGFHGHSTVYDSRPSGNRWYVYGYSSGHIIAYATCARIQP